MDNISASNSTGEPALESPVDNVQHLIQLIVHMSVFLLGVPGNCLILRVYWTKTCKTSTHVLIMALAWADLIVCLLRVREITGPALLLAGKQVPHELIYIWPFDNTAIVSTFVITAIVAADRHDCICRPQRRFFTHRRAKIAVWATMLFSFVTNIPTFIIAFDSYTLTLKMLMLIVDTASFLVALVMVVVCYGRVYMTIRKHVKVGVLSLSTTRTEHSSLIDEKTSTKLLSRAPATSETNVSVVAEFTHQPSTQCTTRTDFGTGNNISDATTSIHIIPDSSPGDADPTSVNQQPKPAIQDGISEEKVAYARPGGKSTHTDPTPRSGAQCTPQRVGGADLQRKTTRMLFITSAVFLLTWLPYLICNIDMMIGGPRTVSDGVFQNIIDNLRVVLLINNVVNPLIYGLANRRFRKDCREVLSKMRLC